MQMRVRQGSLKAVEDEKCTNNLQIEALMMKYQSLVRALTLTVQLLIGIQAAGLLFGFENDFGSHSDACHI